MYFNIVLLNEKCSKCTYQLFNSNDLVRTASARWNNELSVCEQTFYTYHCFKICFKQPHTLLPKINLRKIIRYAEIVL